MHGTKPLAREEPPWPHFWRLLNIAGASVLGGYVFLFHDRAAYDWATRSSTFFAAALLGLLGVVPLLQRVRRDAAWAVAWVVLAAAAVGIGAVRAAGDAFERNHADCWLVEERPEGVDIMGCAPGHQPIAGSYYDSFSETGSSRTCELLNASGSTGATRWRCRTERL